MIPYIAIVKQYERLAVFTLGKYAGMRQPGVAFLIWAVPGDEENRPAGGRDRHPQADQHHP